MGRFSYVQYDETAQKEQQNLKSMMEGIESRIDAIEPLSPSAGRAKALIYTKLEETYMWMGKLIRDNQVHRSGQCKEQVARGNE